MIAFVFPGQGSQVVGMGKALADQFDICKQTFAEADAALNDSLSDLIFNGPADRLTLTENTQPAVLTMSIAVWRLLDSRGLKPAFLAGHSLGEYSAHVAAGTLQFADAVRLVRNRGRYMQEAVPVGAGAMAAIIGLDEEGVIRACEEAADGEVVSPANLNGAGQIVIAGTAAAVSRAGERAKALGAKLVIPLSVSAPFHCALMKPAEGRMTPELRSVPTAEPRVPVVANVDAMPKRTAAASIDALIQQIASPIRWEDVVKRLESEGVTRYVEVGPGKALSGMIKRIAKGVSIHNVEGPGDLAAIEAATAAATEERS
jgi:[acyl-carrier-protein] S-malonyltransferase